MAKSAERPVTSTTADWANFYGAEVGDSAALTGLVVVAISINLNRILAFPSLPRRAAESLVLLVIALVLTSFGLVPWQPLPVFGVEVTVIGSGAFGFALHNYFRTGPLVEGLTRSKLYLNLAVSTVATIPFVIGGFFLMCGSGVGLYLTAVGIVVCLTAGVWNAWVLLIEIMR
jgi:hypothetical protein